MKKWIAALAVLVTIIIIIEFLVDSKINTAPPPRIVYTQDWPANRSDAQIVADQKLFDEKDRAGVRLQAALCALELLMP